MQLTQGFSAPDFTQELKVGEYRRLAPAHATIRGMFFDQVTSHVNSRTEHGFSSAKHSLYQRYPLAEYLDHALQAVSLCYPDEPVQEGLRKLGTDVYPYFEQTMPGKAIFAFAGNQFERVATLAGKGYEVALSEGYCETSVGPGKAIAKLRNVWTFANCLQIGIWQGAMRVCGLEGSIRIREHSLCDVDLEITW